MSNDETQTTEETFVIQVDQEDPVPGCQFQDCVFLTSSPTEAGVMIGRGIARAGLFIAVAIVLGEVVGVLIGP